jgi:hypothetical protein
VTFQLGTALVSCVTGLVAARYWHESDQSQNSTNIGPPRRRGSELSVAQERARRLAAGFVSQWCSGAVDGLFGGLRRCVGRSRCTAVKLGHYPRSARRAGARAVVSVRLDPV